MIRRMLVCFTLAVWLTSCTEISRTYHQCLLEPAVSEALSGLLERSWDGVHPEDLGDSWPASASWGSRADGNANCSGTMTFSHLGYVVNGECRCCDVFAFSDAARGSSCAQNLSSITLVRYAKSRKQATVTAERFLSVVSPAEPKLSNLTATRIRIVNPAVQESSSVDITQLKEGWVVRMTTYRVSFSETTARTTSSPVGGMQVR